MSINAQTGQCLKFPRALYDIKATDMGSQSVMFKAEVDIDGREIARSYLERIDIQLILKVCLSPSLYSGRWVYSSLVLF